MIGSRIGILEKFGVSSVTMAYYGPAHKSFMLLSTFSQKSREMLDAFFDAILFSFLESATVLSISDDNIKSIYLPSSLFRFNINLKNDIATTEFINFLDNLQARKGYYFNKHFMHDQLCIWRIYVETNITQKLGPYVDIMKSFSITFDSYLKQFETDISSNTIFGRISLKDKNWFRKNNSKIEFPYSEKEDEVDQSKLVFNHFKRIYFLYLMFETFDDSLWILNQIKTFGLFVDFIHLKGSSPEEWECLINPDYFNKGLNSLHYCFNEFHLLTEKTFKNIQKIGPKSVSFELKYNLIASFDYILILK